MTISVPFTCPSCGAQVTSCIYCDRVAVYEGWTKSAMVTRRVQVCDEHAHLLKGYEKFIKTFKDEEE